MAIFGLTRLFFVCIIMEILILLLCIVLSVTGGAAEELGLFRLQLCENCFLLVLIGNKV